VVNIAIYADTPFGDEDAFNEFLGHHAAAHKGIAETMMRSGLQSNSIPLADTPMDNQPWMLDHYQLHIGIGSQIGLGTPDLASYDLKDETQYTDWMAVHSALHSAINAKLGITS
jgi:hypothetical protein